MANTFIQLNDTPGSYNLAANKFAKVNSAGDAIQFWEVYVTDLGDVSAQGAYAPSTGDALIYNSDGYWKPGTMDVYSAGNGLNKVGLNLNVQAGAGGGLTSNSNGVYITDIANVSGTYGNATHHPVLTVNSKGQLTGVTTVASTVTLAEDLNASYVGNVIGTSGQINVVGGTGQNSNATLNLVATGVTAGVYGNTTHIPQITVDTYGRVQNIDLVNVTGNISGSGNANVAQYASLAYKTITVEGSGTQTSLSADQYDDTLTFVAGGGISLTTNAAQDKLTFTSNGEAIVGTASVGDLSDVTVSGVADGQPLVWSASNSRFEPGNVSPTLADSGVSAGTYGDTGNVAQFTVDAKGRITSVTEIAIPQGDITGVTAGTGLDGGGTNGTVTLNLEQTGVSAGSYGNSEVIPRITVDVLGRITSVTEQAPASSGVTAGTYGTATVIPRISVDAQGRVTSVSNISVASHIQSLSFNASTKRLSIGGANTVDLSSLVDDDAQTLALSGNTLSISNGNSVDLSSFAGGSGGSDSQTLTLAGNNLSISNGNTVDLSNISGSSNAFSTVSVAGQSDVVATNEDAITIVGGDNITVETNASAQSITISSTAINQGLDFGTFSAPSGITLDMGSF